MKKNNNMAFTRLNFSQHIFLFIFTFSLLSIGLLSNSSVLAQGDEVKLAPDHPQSYTVVKDDTLWDISEKFLQNPWQWPEIWQINPQIKNPHLIYPGDILELVYVDGKPVIQRRSGPRPTFKLSPQKRIEELDQSIPTIALEKLAPFLSGNIVVERDTLSKSPYIVGTAEGHLIATTGMDIYAQNIPRNLKTNRFGIFRNGDVYRNPRIPSEIIGYEAILVGDAFLKVRGNPSTLEINSAKTEILNGYRVIPLDDNNFDRNFSPKAANTAKTGEIISSLNSGIQSGVSNIGAFDVVIIALGTKDGIETGDVFNIYRHGQVIVDPVEKKKRIRLPNEIAGNLLVFRPFKRVSYAIVMDASQIIKSGDIVKSPHSR